MDHEFRDATHTSSADSGVKLLSSQGTQDIGHQSKEHIAVTPTKPSTTKG